MTTGKAELPFRYDAERTASVYGNITSWDKPKCPGSTGQHANVHNGTVIKPVGLSVEYPDCYSETHISKELTMANISASIY